MPALGSEASVPLLVNERLGTVVRTEVAVWNTGLCEGLSTYQVIVVSLVGVLGASTGAYVMP